MATRCQAPSPAASSGNACPTGDPVALKVTEIASGLTRPVYVTAAPGDMSRLFVLERTGAIKLIDLSSGTPTVMPTNFLDVTVSSSTNANTESGLLGLAFHPDFPEDPRFFLNYNRRRGVLSTFIDEYAISDNPDQADPNSRRELLTFSQPQGNHNGGMIEFGPDGCLYVGSGDGGNANDIGTGHAPEGNGQSLATPLGKLLRLDVDAPETPPPGNLTGAGTDPLIWDYGLRNPWRFSFDRDTGDLYIGDVGQGAWEEIDVAPAGKGNINWGWPEMEGSSCFRIGCDSSAYELPVDEYRNAGSDDCVIGGYVYRGDGIPSLQGYYIYADNGSNRVAAFVWDGQGRCGDRTLDLTAQIGGRNVTGDITSFGEDAAGELYMTTIDGYVYRIEAQ